MVGTVSQIQNSAAQQTVLGATKELGKNEFLQLLVAQLRNQDPMDPMKDNDFIAQMSQFSSLEQLMNMNSSLTDSINLDYMTSQSIANSMATSLLGKTVTADTDAIYLSGSEPAQIHYNLAGDASEVKINIYNEDGVLVDSIYDEDAGDGMNAVAWDGVIAGEAKAAAGNYHVEIQAMAADGSRLEAKPFLIGRAERVQYLNGAAYLLIDGVMIMLGDIVEVKA